MARNFAGTHTDMISCLYLFIMPCILAIMPVFGTHTGMISCLYLVITYAFIDDNVFLYSFVPSLLLHCVPHHSLDLFLFVVSNGYVMKRH